MPSGHKVFVSYYHQDDEKYRNLFESYFGNVYVSKSVQMGDIDPSSHDGFWEALTDHGDTVSTARNDIISEFNYHNTWGKQYRL